MLLGVGGLAAKSCFVLWRPRGGDRVLDLDLSRRKLWLVLGIAGDDVTSLCFYLVNGVSMNILFF
jgi:hypothetical protein